MHTIDTTVFRRSVVILFWLGQFPVILLTAAFMFAITRYYGTGERETMTLLLWAVLAIVLSFVAMSDISQKVAVTLLCGSLIVTLVYLHRLVGLTGGTESHFQHMYLYLPAVVFMVAQCRTWAEGLCSLLVLYSYVLHVATGRSPTSEAWQAFKESSGFPLAEAVFFSFLVTLLYVVNRRMEKVVRATPDTTSVEVAS